MIGISIKKQNTYPLNYTTTFGYDATGSLTHVTDALTRVTDALNRTTTYSYDPLNRQVTMVNALGDDSTTTYDAEGNITAVTDELNRTTRLRYNNRNLLTQMVDPLGHSTNRVYDAIGNLISVSDALGNTTQYGYDALYRQTQVIDALGETTGMTYDGVGNLASLSDASGNLTTFTYDALERLETETITVDGQALTRRYGYDATSNLTSLIDRNGRTQQFTYDALNRQTQEQWLDDQGNATRQISYTYDVASQLTTANDPASTYAYTYDLAGRLTSVNNAGTPGVPNVVLSYGYDAVNNLTTVTDTINGVQAGTETASYDALNRVTKMTQSGAGVAAKRVEMAYDAASQMTGLSRYSSLTGTQVVAGTSYGYDLAGRLTDLTHQRGATIIADYGFTYDAANRLTQLTTPDGTSNYGYNNRYELTSSDHSYQGDEAYNYDATGNRTSYTTGDHNRLMSDGTYNYEYDNEGNRTRRVEIATGKATEYTWDYRNRLTGVVSKNGAGTITQTVLYAYDVYNRRLSSAVDADGAGAGVAAEEHFVYDGSHIALVFDGAGTLTHRYFHGPQIDQVLAEETAGQTRWALGDHQGSVRDVINNTGTVLNHTVYDNFGQVTGESNPALDFRFGYTGRELDEESGLMQYRARYYDPAVGTFVGEDPLGFGAGDSNLYRYVFNSPTNFTDPDGQSAEIPYGRIAIETAIGVGAAAAGIYQSGKNIVNEWKTLPRQTESPTSFEPFSTPNLPDAGAFPTTIATPGEFSPNPDRSRDRDANPPVNLIPPAPRPTAGAAKDFNPNSINDKSHSHPNSRDLPWPDDFCPAPWLDGDAKPDFEKPWFEIGISDIPDDWLTKPSDGEGGIIYTNPNNTHDRVRVMPGNPKSSHASQRQPYVIRQKDRKFFDKDGNEVPRQSAESHIPAEDFEFFDP